MKCPECEKQSIKSNLHLSGGSITLMSFSPYYDEEGEYHSHDPNAITRDWYCSEGHRGRITEKRACPAVACGVKGSLEIHAFPHEGANK